MREGGPELRDRGNSAVATAVVAVLAAAAALLYTYPLILHWRETVPFRVAAGWNTPVQGLLPGDHLQLYYYMALVRDMWDGLVPWFSDPYQFHAPEPNPHFNPSFLPFSAVFVLAAPLGGPAAYNLVLWGGYVVSALAFFGLARRLGQSDLAAGVAAAVGMLMPCHVVRAAYGHPSGVFFFMLPLLFYCLERAWQERSRPAAAAAGLSIAVLAVNEPHYVYFLAFLLPAWLLSVFWRSTEPAPRPAPVERAQSAALLLASAVGPAVYYAVYSARHSRLVWTPASVVLLVVFMWMALAICWRATGELRGRIASAAWSREAGAYLPLLLLALYPVQIALDVPRLGTALIAATALALVVARWRQLGELRSALRGDGLRRTADMVRILWPFAIGLAIAAAFILHLKEGALEQSVSAAGRTFKDVSLFSPRVGAFFDRREGSDVYPGGIACLLALAGLATRPARPIAAGGMVFAVLALGTQAATWLPIYRIAFEVVPFFQMIRQSAKFFAIAGIALALLAGFGVEAAIRRLGRRAGAIVALLALCAVAIDFSNVLPFGLSNLPAENRAYAAVAERARGTNLLELPIWPGDSHYSSLYLYWTIRTKVPIVNGYSPFVRRDYVEHVARPLDAMNIGELTAAEWLRLRELGVRFVTFHRDAFPPKVSAYPYRYTLAAMRHNPNLEAVAQDSGIYLFALHDGEYRPWEGGAPSPLGVFFEAEGLRGYSPRIADEGASGGTVVRGVMTDPPFPVMSGPYRAFPRGHYAARFRTRGSGRLEVTTNDGKLVFASAPVDSADFQDSVLDFQLDGVRRLELRAWPGWTGFLDVDWVLIEKRDPAPGAVPDRIEAEDLPMRLLFDEDDPGASGGAYAVIDGPSGIVLRDGPYRRFGPGRLRVAARGRGAAFDVRVESADERRKFAELTVPAAPSWATAAVEFDLPAEEILCTRIVSGGARSDADYVEIGPAR